MILQQMRAAAFRHNKFKLKPVVPTWMRSLAASFVLDQFKTRLCARLVQNLVVANALGSGCKRLDSNARIAELL